MALVLIESDLTVAAAINGTQIGKLSKIDKSTTLKVLNGLVLRQAEFFNVRANLTDMQSVVLANDLMEVFNYETLEDVVLMFKLARQGRFGQVFGRLDSETIMGGWVPAYLELKAQERENHHRKEKGEHMRNAEPNQKNKEGIKILEKLSKELREKKEAKRSKPEQSPINHYEFFIQKLPETCKFLSDQELKTEMNRAKLARMWDAHKIYETELKSRETEKQTIDENI